jgi:hypothetical protein
VLHESIVKSKTSEGDTADLKRNSFRAGINFFATLSSQSLPKLRRRVFLIGFLVAAFTIVEVFSPMGRGVFAESGQANKPSQPRIDVDVQRLEGRWVRPDGGYILELRDIKKDGNLTATYFNPKQIKVFSATWTRKEGKINLFVELRDINYPGSKYNLQYDPMSDRLKGTYFQAVEKQTFNIEFIRAK